MKIKDRIKGLRRVQASELKPHPKNWRTHPKNQQNAMRGVLADIGMADALIVRELPDKSLQILDGHLRAETTPDQKVPCLIVDLNDEEALKLLATHDALTGLAKANPDVLLDLVAEIKIENDDVADMLNGLVASIGGGAALIKQGLVDPNEVPEPPDEPVTRPGDLWILGNHRLLCGDSSRPEDVDRLIDGAPIHLVNTDPPYNVKVEPRSKNAFAAGLSSFQNMTKNQTFDLARRPDIKPAGKMRAKDRPLKNDFVSDEEFDQLLDAWFGNIARVLEPGRTAYIWGGYKNCANYPPFLKKHKLYFSQAIIWDKEHPVLTRKDFMGAHEWCFYCWKEGTAHQFFGPNNASDLWHVKKIHSSKMVHLTEKPVELAVRAIQYSSRPGENVLDMFGGIGSTLIGAEQTGRNAFLIELDPAYCDVIVQRYEEFTGNKATRSGVNGNASAPAKRKKRKAKKKTPTRGRGKKKM